MTMITNGAEFTTWGSTKFDVPTRVRVGEDESRIAALCRSIERKNRLAVANCQPGMSYQEHGKIVSTQYEITLGMRLRTGGFSVAGRLFCSIKRAA